MPQGGGEIAAALSEAATAWLEVGDERALRRALLDVLRNLDDR